MRGVAGGAARGARHRARGGALHWHVGLGLLELGDAAAAEQACASHPAVHVGLGAVGRADELLVRWVDGTLEAFGASDADRTVSLRRGDGDLAQR